MKNFKLLTYVIIAASSLLFFQCTSDYKTIDGVDGINGLNGADGVDGVDASAASCIECHSEQHREGIYDAYFAAKHATGSSWARGTSSSCAKCHNNAGFVDFVETGAVSPAGYSVSNPITCTGCHNIHRSFDFENDGNDMAVRTLDAVPFAFLDGTEFEYTLDYGNASNTCANCHQPRRGTPTATDYPGQYKNTSSHWGPHHGPQTALLEGLQGAYTTFTLVEAIPAAQAATHRTGSSCIECHMGGTTDGSYGHSWNPAGTNCATCHEDTPFEDLVVSGMEEDMATLGALLENVVGQAIDDDDEPIFEADGVTPVEVHGIVHWDGEEWHPVVGLFDLKDAEAGWNFLYILEDKSGGIHNPDYARSIIKNSIAAMQE